MAERINEKLRRKRFSGSLRFNSVADSMVTKKARLSTELFNNPNFGWEIAKIKGEYDEKKMSLDLSQSALGKCIINERDSNFYDDSINNQHEDLNKVSIIEALNYEAGDTDVQNTQAINSPLPIRGDSKKVSVEFKLFDSFNQNNDKYTKKPSNTVFTESVIESKLERTIKDDAAFIKVDFNEIKSQSISEEIKHKKGLSVPRLNLNHKDLEMIINESFDTSKNKLDTNKSNLESESMKLKGKEIPDSKGFVRTRTKNIDFVSSRSIKAKEEVPFNKLTPKEKFRRIYLKITIVLLFNYIWNRMKFYGLNVLKGDIEEEIEHFAKSKININQDAPRQSPICSSFRFYIHPYSSFFLFWNILRICLYFYSVSYMIYLICLVDRLKPYSTQWTLDYLIELLFLIDIIIQFTTGFYEKNDLVTNNLKIAIRYLSSWFIVDLIGIFPMEFILGSVSKIKFSTSPSLNYHRMVRILNTTRFYRLFQHYESMSFIKTLMKYRFLDNLMKKLRMNAGINRLINTLFLVLVLSHIFACIWYYSAKWDQFNEDTWVARNNLLDADLGTIYLTSIYYSLTVVTTVGFGDINSNTVTERILTCLWMVIGVAFYSFIISNLSSIISSMDFHSSVMQKKIDNLNEFAQKLNIPDDIYLKIKKVYEENDQQYFIQNESQLFEDLPYNIKVEILYHIHHENIMANTYLLDRNINLVVEILTNWKAMTFSSNEFVYLEGESSYDSILSYIIYK